mgnify:CR=1 FL=1
MDQEDRPLNPRLDRLNYRRQFVLGSSFIREFSGWREMPITESLCLTSHPDLDVSRVAEGDRSLVLLGYMIDPEEPEQTSADILGRLFSDLTERDSIFSLTSRIGGRWILILVEKHKVFLFHDATGLRQVFFTAKRSLDLWCASQPELIANRLKLALDPNAIVSLI